MMTGWDIPDLVDCLIKESKGEIAGLQSFLETYPLAAMSADKKHLVVIRDFSFHAIEGKINMMNAMGYGEQSHKGMTLVSAGDDGGNQRNVILPNGLGYTEVRLTETQIDIYFGKEKKTTNFQEINKKLWSVHKLTEPEILDVFHSLENKLVEKIKIKRQTVDVIKTDLFGILKLDDKVDCYRGGFVDKEMTIEVLFTNVAKELFDRNMMTTHKALKKLGDIQNSMATEMLPLKNETWLNENEKEIGRDAFLEIVKLYGLTVFEDGTIQLYFKAGDLFWGHEIITKVDSKGNHVNSMIAG